jgi:hypothetical protein
MVETWVAEYDYNAQDDDEVTVVDGDVLVDVKADVNAGWVRAGVTFPHCFAKVHSFFVTCETPCILHAIRAEAHRAEADCAKAYRAEADCAETDRAEADRAELMIKVCR